MKYKIPFNFGGLSGEFSDYDNSGIVILPVPFDKTTTWLKGSDKGPGAVIDASRNLELFDIETGSEIYKRGISTEKEILVKNSEVMINRVYDRVRKLLTEKKFVVALGGEHTICIGAIKAYPAFFDGISILHLDAHTDMRDSYEENRFSHACVMARVKEIINDIISVGIRGMDSSEFNNIDKNKVFYALGIHESRGWINEVVEKLSDNVYVTIDLDVFDPSMMPSVSTPEPGGLDWYQVTGLLKAVSEKRNIIGFDVTELCPSKNKAPDFLAAKLIYTCLSYIFSNEEYK